MLKSKMGVESVGLDIRVAGRHVEVQKEAKEWQIDVKAAERRVEVQKEAKARRIGR